MNGNNQTNPWLQSAFSNTINPNMDFQSFLQERGIDVDPTKVGKFFSGITDDYQQDIQMGRASLQQTWDQARAGAMGQMFGLSGGQGFGSVGGGGFGRQGYNLNRSIGGVNTAYGQNMQSGLLGFAQDRLSAQRRMESQFMDVASGLLSRDSAGISQADDDSGYYKVTSDPRQSGYLGRGTVEYMGNLYNWSEEEGTYI